MLNVACCRIGREKIAKIYKFKSSTTSSTESRNQSLFIVLFPFSIRTAEWCFPLTDLNRALALVIQLAQDYATKHLQYNLLPIYVRLVKTDDLFVSPASMLRPDGSNSQYNCYIEVREIDSFQCSHCLKPERGLGAPKV